jgi:glycosyltransferase involved in cell wall biosynthesis
LTGRTIDRVGVVVPAHNEADQLPSCLDALAVAARRVAVPVDVVVVLDACTDDSRAAAGATPTIEIAARNVGIARRAGFTALRSRRPAHVPDEHVWLATTDADSRVPADWLIRMIAYADAGWHVVAGTVCVEDWSEHWGDDSERLRRAWALTYQPGDQHPHVHGANLGFRADCYAAVGGIPAVALSEDASLLTAFEAAGYSVRRAGDLPVVTSARRDARAAGGFGTFLDELDVQAS